MKNGTKVKFKNIYSDDLGSMSPIICEEKPNETAKEEFLWHINSARDHDGLPPISTLRRISYDIEIVS
jgi:hypothetical protein